MKLHACLFAILLSCSGASALADAVVLANRARQSVSFELVDETDSVRTASLARGAARAFWVPGEIAVRFAGDEARRYELEPGAVYFFHDHNGAGPIELGQVLLRHVDRPPIANSDEPAPDAAPPRESAASTDGVFRLRVKILVDGKQRAARSYWEPRLRKRVAAASRVFEQSCGFGFEVIAAETWKEDDPFADFEASLIEFQRRVDPAPGQLAIGFTSQHRIPYGQRHIDGVRGPLASHVLLREGAEYGSEAERLELLVHELGHYLGAVHCPESNSVMRPFLADRQIVARDFPLAFDPLNTLAMSVVAEEVRDRGVEHLGMLSVAARRRLRDIYATLQESLPGDPAAEIALGQVADPTPIGADVRSRPDERAGDGEPLVAMPADGPADVVAAQEPPLVIATRAILRAISARARSFQASTKAGEAAPSGQELLTGYVRAAAETAAQQPLDVRAQAFLLALAIGLDRSDALRKYAVMGDLVATIEPDAERVRRLEALGAPTIHQRHDLVQHFVLSAAIASSSGTKSAEAVALAKQLHDARYGGGFSFAAWCADLSGIAFAERVQRDQPPLAELARTFRSEAVLPSLEGLPETLSMQTFKTRYGSANDERFRVLDGVIRQRIAALADADESGAD